MDAREEADEPVSDRSDALLLLLGSASCGVSQGLTLVLTIAGGSQAQDG